MSVGDATSSIQHLLHSLQKLSPQLKGREEDLKFLQHLINSNEFHSLIQVHHDVSAATHSSATPVCSNALTISHSVAYDLEKSEHSEAQELFDLLTSPHIDSLVSTHDRIANKEYPVGQSAAMNARAPSVGDDTARIVSIEKQQEPLGATVRAVKNGKIVISRVLHRGAADKSGLLHPGDIIHEINGKSILGFTVDAVADLMAELRGTVVFKITPAISDQRPKRRSQPPKYMRALFSYDPQQDRHAPCPEAGLKFEQGGILHVVNEDDPNWWQAVHYGEKSLQAGIIPSKSLKEKLECLEEFTKHQTTKKRRKAKKTLYSSFESEEFGQEVITYEQVVKIDPQVDRPRPIMIVAPRGGPFNLEDLSARLVDGDPERYGTPIPHTSRPPQPGEAEKQIYHFVSRQRMEKDIQNNQFVEHGFFSGHYYGTSINSIRSIINAKKTCILVLIPQAIKLVRTAELKPFVVYCRSPNINYMKKHWVPKGQIKESHIPDIFRQAVFLERTYSHYFDHTILFTDLDTAVLEISKIADRLTKEPQWVPSSWV